VSERPLVVAAFGNGEQLGPVVWKQVGRRQNGTTRAHEMVARDQRLFATQERKVVPHQRGQPGKTRDVVVREFYADRRSVFCEFGDGFWRQADIGASRKFVQHDWNVDLLPKATDNLANFLRTLATPETIERWSLTSLRERLIKTGARLVRHGRYAIFQMAETALPQTVFAGILGLINTLRGPPAEISSP